MKLLTTMVNSFKFKRTLLLILLFVGTQGYTETKCEATEGMILKCQFPKNIESTETDFVIYFYPEDGKTELLADCWWENKELECILQDSVEMKRPLSDIAVISLPPRFVSIPGTYKCIPDGANSENSKACQFHKSQKEGEESQDKSVNEVQLQNPVERLPEKQHDQEGAETSTAVIVGAAIGSIGFVAVIIFILCVVHKFSTPNANSSLALKNGDSKEPTDNKATDPVSDTQLSQGSQPASLQRSSSAGVHDDNKPLLQLENENVAIREDVSHEYSDTFRSSLEPKDRSCDGFLRENNYSNDRY